MKRPTTRGISPIPPLLDVDGAQCGADCGSCPAELTQMNEQQKSAEGGIGGSKRVSEARTSSPRARATRYCGTGIGIGTNSAEPGPGHADPSTATGRDTRGGRPNEQADRRAAVPVAPRGRHTPLPDLPETRRHLRGGTTRRLVPHRRSEGCGPVARGRLGIGRPVRLAATDTVRTLDL